MIEEIYETVDKIIAAQKIARRNNDFLTLLTNGEALLEFLPKIIEYSVDEESAYRKFEAKLANEMTDGKRNSSSYCDTQAKATDNYRNWQRSKLIIELMYEMVNIAKKLASSVNSEFNSSK
jgi:hypothetical protein